MGEVRKFTRGFVCRKVVADKVLAGLAYRGAI